MDNLHKSWVIDNRFFFPKKDWIVGVLTLWRFRIESKGMELLSKFGASVVLFCFIVDVFQIFQHLCHFNGFPHYFFFLETYFLETRLDRFLESCSVWFHFMFQKLFFIQFVFTGLIACLPKSLFEDLLLFKVAFNFSCLMENLLKSRFINDY